MKTYTPQISWHNRQPILSVDIQNRPYCQEETSQVYRLATGGNDSQVIIWKISIVPNVDPKKPIDSIECLAELTQHQRSVNIVRFSPNLNENFLASGDDDSLIFIWKLCDSDNGVATSGNIDENETKETNIFLDSDAISIETWKTYKILRGHNQDVSDLCWSQDGQYIVSGSVDNNVFVWDVHRGNKLHKVVKEHCSYVLGVSWDPLNKYVASLSADRNMIIFNAKNGKTVNKVFKVNFEENKTSSKLFYDQTLMSFCRRLTFSPGGELLFAPSGILESGSDKYENTVYIFERHSFNRPTFYLPTIKYSIAVKCCPVVFELKTNTENLFKFPYRIVFAVATQDSLLFYDSQQLTPFAYVSQIHYLSLTDISWSPNGRILIVTSTDGFSSFVVFQENELGIPYKGKLLELEELEPAILPTKQNNINKPNPIKVASAEKDKEKKFPMQKPSTPITAFFKKTVSPSSTNSPAKSSVLTPKNSNTADQENKIDKKPKNGRRVSLITLFTPSQNNVSSSNIDKQEEQYETGIKRKHFDNNEPFESHCDT